MSSENIKSISEAYKSMNERTEINVKKTVKKLDKLEEMLNDVVVDVHELQDQFTPETEKANRTVYETHAEFTKLANRLKSTSADLSYYLSRN